MLRGYGRIAEMPTALKDIRTPIKRKVSDKERFLRIDRR
jgi:hypothetical protein